MLSSFEEELAGRLKEPKEKKLRQEKQKIRLIVEAPLLSEEDLEYLQYHMEDYDWKISFVGDFPPDYQVPFFLLKHVA